MAQIKLTLTQRLVDGMDVKFKAPCDCTEVTGLLVSYVSDSGSTASKSFTFRDAHGNDLAGLGNLFASGAYIKAILDTGNGYAYIQNADTNKYIETELKYSTLGLRTPIASGDDLNNYTTVGCYSCRSTTIATSLVNCPVTTIFSLDVKNVGGTGTTSLPASGSYFVLQRIETAGHTIWIRYVQQSGTTMYYGKWERILTTDDVQTFTATLLATGWGTSNGYYYQDLTVSGVSTTMETTILDADTSTITAANAIYLADEIDEAFGLVFKGYVRQENNYRVWARDIPEVDIPIKITAVIH